MIASGLYSWGSRWAITCLATANLSPMKTISRQRRQETARPNDSDSRPPAFVICVEKKKRVTARCRLSPFCIRRSSAMRSWNEYPGLKFAIRFYVNQSWNSDITLDQWAILIFTLRGLDSWFSETPLFHNSYWVCIGIKTILLNNSDPVKLDLWDNVNKSIQIKFCAHMKQA